jgi:hypothetical protein
MNARNEVTMRFAAAWALQAVATLALLALGYWWLTWPDEKLWQVVASLLIAIVMAFFSLWMQCTVFGAFYSAPDGLRLRRSLRSLPAYALWKIVFGIIELALLAFYWNGERYAVRLAQILHLSPRTVTSTLDWGTWGVIWVLVPAVLLPIGSRVARDGFTALRGAELQNELGALRKLRYWLGLAVVLLTGVYLPYRLIHWVPNRATLTGELWSAAVRLSAAYLLAVTALVWLAWSLVRTLAAPAEEGTPPAPQPSTSA